LPIPFTKPGEVVVVEVVNVEDSLTK